MDKLLCPKCKSPDITIDNTAQTDMNFIGPLVENSALYLDAVCANCQAELHVTYHAVAVGE